jgi:branched-chain amino acid transport system permease protein
MLITFRDISVTIPPLIEGSVDFFGVKLTYIKLLALVIAIGVIVALEIFIKKTRLGREINATSQSYESAMMVGIDVERIFLITLLLSSILAGIGGVLYAQIYSLNPETTFKILIYAFAIVILGGLGSVKGSIVSAFIIGYIQIFVSLMLGTRWSELAVIVVIIVILIVKPKGLFGVE